MIETVWFKNLTTNEDYEIEDKGHIKRLRNNSEYKEIDDPTKKKKKVKKEDKEEK